MSVKSVIKLYGRKDILENKILTFDDLVFEEHQVSKSTKQVKDKLPELWNKVESVLSLQIDATGAYIQFPNKRHISVLFGECFYSDGKTTYECLESYVDRPEGYCTKEQVTKLMAEIQAKPEYTDELEQL